MGKIGILAGAVAVAVFSFFLFADFQNEGAEIEQDAYLELPAIESVQDDGSIFVAEETADETDVSIVSQEEKTEETVVNEPLTEPEINEILTAGVNWFKNAQEENGHFRYEYLLLTDEYADDDHIVRQMGALYVLGEILKGDGEQIFNLKGNVKRAISYAEVNSASGNFNGYAFTCIIQYGDRCPTGATALALVGILDLLSAYPDEKKGYGQLLESYKNFILAMRKENGGFRGNYYLFSNQTKTESSFSNGEAFLALARYYRYSPDEEVKQALDDAFAYFDALYREQWDPNFYLWGMAALKDIYEMEKKDAYVSFAKEYTDWRMNRFVNLRGTYRNLCAYFEGVVSAFSVFGEEVSKDERARYLEEINFWLSKSRELQVGDDGFAASVIGGRVERIPLQNKERARGGFVTDLYGGELRQRIDFTQHCLSAYSQRLADKGIW